jgi:hypothetical protein
VTSGVQFPNYTGLPQIQVVPGAANPFQPNSGHSTMVTLMYDGSIHSTAKTITQNTWTSAVNPADGVPLGTDW